MAYGLKASSCNPLTLCFTPTDVKFDADFKALMKRCVGCASGIQGCYQNQLLKDLLIKTPQ